jgi:hypothetical protein
MAGLLGPGADAESLVLGLINRQALRTLVLRCKEAAREGWPERFAAFVSRNAAALQQLRHLNLGDEVSFKTSAPLTSSVLAALARLPGLQSLHARVDKELNPPAGRRWAASSS